MTASSGCNGGVTTTSRQVVPLLPRGPAKIPILKMFTYSELRTATKNFRQEMFLAEGGYVKVFKGWLTVKHSPRRRLVRDLLWQSRNLVPTGW